MIPFRADDRDHCATAKAAQPIQCFHFWPLADIAPAPANVAFDPKRSSGLGAVAIATFKSAPLRKVQGASGRVNASIFLYLWIGYGVANHVVGAGPQSGFRLVLRALQTSRNVFGAACGRDLLCVWATDSERSSLRFRRAYGCASLAAFRVEGNGYESGERKVRYCGD
jgi:hypothetical protein